MSAEVFRRVSMAVDVQERRRSSVAKIFRRGSAQVQLVSEAGPSTPSERRPSLTAPLQILKLSKSARSAPVPEPATVCDASDNNLGSLFFSLPSELCVHIVSELRYRDLLALRLVCHDFHHLIHDNASAIVLNYVKTNPKDLPPFSAELYPLCDSESGPSLDYLFGLTHRHCVAKHLAAVITTFVCTKIYGASHAPPQLKALEPKARKMEKKLVPGLFVLFHFFEEFRRGLTRPDIRQTGAAAMQRGIIEKYDSDIVIEAHQVYQILSAAYTRKLRPPSYAGVFERTLRGWTRSPASESEKLKLLVFGGLRELKNVLRLPSYKERLEALESYNFDLYNRQRLTHQLCTIQHLSCSVMPRLEEQAVRNASASLTGLELRIWNDVALDILLEREVVNPTTGIQDVYNFLSDLMMIEGDIGDLPEASEALYDNPSHGDSDD